MVSPGSATNWQGTYKQTMASVRSAERKDLRLGLPVGLGPRRGTAGRRDNSRKSLYSHHLRMSDIFKK